MDFDEEDSEEDPERNLKDDSEEDLEADSEGVPEQEAEEFYEDNPKGEYNADMEVEVAGREEIMSEERPPESEIFELSDFDVQLDMSDSLPVETSTDLECTSSDDDCGDADFDPDLYKQDRDRMDASPFAK